jgi:hypothetical protein
MMKNYPELGIQVADILLPKESIDLEKWAVIACDQYTSQPEYWQKVREFVGDSPSTLNMILPEVYLGTPAEADLIRSTQATMRRYLSENLLVCHEGMLLVERSVDGKTRHGLMVALDLDRYDFSKGSQSLIRATEGTILERLPPRMRIREGAPIELPHIMVLIDDPERTVIEPLVTVKDQLPCLYDTNLMMGSGHLRGWQVASQAHEDQVIQALRRLADPERFRQHYQVGPDKGVLLLAVGDGNHSLATAKSIWEKIKPQLSPAERQAHPARFALVEVENVHDTGLAFEPIHRVLFGVHQDWKTALEKAYGSRMRYSKAAKVEEMMAEVNRPQGDEQIFGVVTPEETGVIAIREPSSNLAVGTLQAFLDEWIKSGGADQIDYVHGNEVLSQLATRPGNLGFYLPPMDKNALFKTVILDGALPRKTFSMGEAHEKRFYMESRRIEPPDLKDV